MEKEKVLERCRIRTSGAECMKLEPFNQTDVECKLRTAEGLDAICEIAPALKDSSLQTWRSLIQHLIQTLSFDPNYLLAFPYDFRLPPRFLQLRDNYFYTMMKRIEIANEFTFDTSLGEGVVVIAHSTGNNVFRYFLEWLKYEKGPFHYQEWIKSNIVVYAAVAAPHLGNVEALRASVSGVNHNIPFVSEQEARSITVTFGAAPWSFPFPSESDNLTDNVIAIIKFPIESEEQANFLLRNGQINAEENTPEELDEQMTQIGNHSDSFNKSNRSFSKHYDRTQIEEMFDDLLFFGDEKAEYTLSSLQNFFRSDPILDPFTPWQRPPIQRVYCVYGTNRKTPKAYKFAKGLGSQWILDGGEQGIIHEENRGKGSRKSGDGTVTYASLSHCHSWLSLRAPVKVSYVPQNFFAKKSGSITEESERSAEDENEEEDGNHDNSTEQRDRKELIEYFESKDEYDYRISQTTSRALSSMKHKNGRKISSSIQPYGNWRTLVIMKSFSQVCFLRGSGRSWTSISNNKKTFSTF
eukprot:TRINITY_DN5910_c0_g1_i1.p1 TRINITY_DN5910_c0_g1~~TRINITY_DN5910_c0_g1_i1.p1  ORF type:complete len:524 (+),score=100.61 TRINITY_DN5910_c0_g1_i1:340-1911(+)